MNNRDRIKEAYENVAFYADRTWLKNGNLYQKTNLDLYLAEINLEKILLKKTRPRTVREWIPRSHLAQYSNYEYNESREMSYSPSNSNPSLEYHTSLPTEPWEMPEVESLFRWFLNNSPEYDFSRVDHVRYESPLLNACGFEDRILKAQVTEAKVKDIWNRIDMVSVPKIPKTYDATVMVFLSYLNNFFVMCRPEVDADWFRKISLSHDFEQIGKLSKQLKDHNDVILKRKHLYTNSQVLAEPVSTEISYSEVVQGLLPIKRSILKVESEIRKSNTTTGADHAPVLAQPTPLNKTNDQLPLFSFSNNNSNNKIRNQTFDNKSSLNFLYQQQMEQKNPQLQQQSQPTKPSVSESFPNFNRNVQPQFPNSQPLISYLDQIMFNSNMYNSQPYNQERLIQDNNYLQTISSWRCTTQQNQFLSITRQNRVPLIQPMKASYVQQAYIYSPLISCQNWIPNFANSYPTTQPTHFVNTPLWFNQNNMISPDQNQYLGHSEIHVAKYNNAKKTLEETWNSSGLINIYNNSNNTNYNKSNLDYESNENLQLLNVCENQYHEELETISFFENHEVTTSISEELEIQALEQYNYKSSDSFYQELELQAEEQYGSSSD